MAKMKSWRFHEFGDIKNLKQEEIDIPEQAEDEALVKVKFADLNPADRFLVMGRYPGSGSPPFAVGRGASGIVMKPGSSRFKEGDAVVLLRGEAGITREGTLAEYVAVPERSLTPLPEWWSFEDGAAGVLVLLTSWFALVYAGALNKGERVVITGAAGGIGLSSLLLANAAGAKTIALSRDPEKQKRLIDLGADHVFSTADPDIVNKIKSLGGADVIVENVTGGFLKKSIDMLNMFGRISVVGALGGITSEISPLDLIFKRVQIHGIQLSTYNDEEVYRAWDDILRLLGPEKGRVPVDSVFPFDRVQDAFECLKQGVFGKVIVGPVNS